MELQEKWEVTLQPHTREGTGGPVSLNEARERGVSGPHQRGQEGTGSSSDLGDPYWPGCSHRDMVTPCEISSAATAATLCL